MTNDHGPPYKNRGLVLLTRDTLYTRHCYYDIKFYRGLVLLTRDTLYTRHYYYDIKF